MQNSSDVITVVDGNGTITYQSPSIERVLGRNSDVLVDASYFDLVHVDARLSRFLRSNGVPSKTSA